MTDESRAQHLDQLRAGIETPAEARKAFDLEDTDED